MILFESMEIPRAMGLIACYSNHVRCGLLAFLCAKTNLVPIFEFLSVVSGGTR